VTARSHPPTLIRVTERTLRDECHLERGERLLVATSGGGDSCALLHVLSILGPKLGFSLVAHGIDHGLRPEAGSELDIAEALARRLGVAFGRSHLNVGAGGNLQARARNARGAALRQAADDAAATRIATAHHADDRAETVLIRLLGGATPRGLAVLPVEDQRLLRPMIRARKADVVAHLARHRIAWSNDPSNADLRFLRVRVRLELLPLLSELSPAIVGHLTGLADDLVLGMPPPVLDEAGQPVPLRRAHVQAVRRALALGRPARVRLPRGRELVFEAKGAELRVDCAPATSTGMRAVLPRSAPPETQEGGAVSRKGGSPKPLASRAKKGGVKVTKSG
jgi:tRNA(Ile)-lysidine synthase